MPSGSYRQINVVCPFYKYDDGKRRITCEGLLDDSSLALIYHRKGDFEAQFRRCCGEYMQCEIYALLMQKYKED